jgi:hypothetical protein
MKTTDRFLQLAHRRARLHLIVWALAFAVLACVLNFASTLDWLPSTLATGYSPILLAAAPALLSFSLLVLWLMLSRRLSSEALARKLDAEWSLSARLESSSELATNPSALAAAQRADAAQYIENQPEPHSVSWFSGLALLALAALLLLAEVSVFGLRLLRPAPEVGQPPEITEGRTQGHQH